MPNISDVAKAAGVSVATVSRVLNGSGKVSAETAKRVSKFIDEMGYRPNLLGRNLRRMRTGIVLVMLPTILNTFYSKIVKGIEDEARTGGYNAMVCITEDQTAQERLFLNIARDRQADGVISMSFHLGADEINRYARHFPIVQCCEYIEGAHCPAVTIDNFEAAREAVLHLASLGHRVIGLISSDNDYVSTRQREKGYKFALEQAGIPFEQGLTAAGDYSYISGYKCALELLKNNPDMTAIFTISDTMAAGAVRAVNELGREVPGDVAVVGFDNIDYASMFRPELTTVAQPQYDMGRKAMDLILSRLETGKQSRKRIIMPHKLIIRESTVKSG